MKNIQSLIIAMVFLSSTLLSSCTDDDDETGSLESYDLGVELTDHTSGAVLTSGNISFKFDIINHGTETIPSGTMVYASAEIDGTLFDFNLLSSDPTAITLDTDLAAGERYTYDAGFLEGASTLAYLQKDAADFCIILWGIGEESVLDMAASDTDVTNNDVCVTYATYDFHTKLSNYESGTILTEGNVELAFDVTNHSEVTFPSSTELMVSAKIGGVLYSLDLLSSDPSVVTVDEDWAPHSTFSFDPGHLDGASTLAFMGLTEGDFCIIVWGIGESSVGEDFPDDTDGTNNEACVTFSAE